MNWSPHLRSLERIITLLSILGFILAGAFLFVLYFGGTTSERGFLTIRHRPRSHQPISPRVGSSRAQPSPSVNPLKSSPEREAERQKSSVPTRSSAAIEAGQVEYGRRQVGEEQSLVLPNEPEAVAKNSDPELQFNSLFLSGQPAPNSFAVGGIAPRTIELPPRHTVSDPSSFSLVAAASAFGAAIYLGRQRVRRTDL